MTPFHLTERLGSPAAADRRARLPDADAGRSEHRLQVLANRLVVAEENERRRIARGLHDDVGQTLAAVRVGLGQLLDRAPDAERDALVLELRELVDRAIHGTRELSFELASAALYEVGLAAGLQSVCERAERRSGIRFIAPAGSAGGAIPQETRVVLYRVGRELVRNVVKHSNARRATVSLARQGSRVRLTVEDDGSGFDASRPLSGFGLFSLTQQLAPIGGSLEIDSSPGSGTRVVVVVPFEATVGT